MGEIAPSDPHRRLDALLADEDFASLERERRRRLRQCGWVVGAAALLVLLVTPPTTLPSALLGLPIAGIAAAVCWVFNGEYRGAVRKALMPAVCRAIGDVEHRTGAGRLPLAELRRAQMLVGWSKEDVDDVFEGIWRDTPFLIAEVRLQTIRRSRDKESTSNVFKGLVFFIETPKPIAPAILMRARRWSPLGPQRPGRRHLDKLQRVAVPDAAFSRRFELWSDHAPAALEVVTPAFAALMTHLSAAAGRHGLDAAFTSTHLILALPRGGDSFAMGSLLRPAGGIAADAHRALDEAMAAHRLIDLLHDGVAAPPPPEPQAS